MNKENCALKLVDEIILYTHTLCNLCIHTYLPTYIIHYIWSKWLHSCLRHCATNRKVAGSIPDGVTGIFL